MSAIRSRASMVLLISLLAGACSEEPLPPPGQLTAVEYCTDFQAHFRAWDSTRKDLWTKAPERLSLAARGDGKAAKLRDSIVRFRSAINQDGGRTCGGGTDIDFENIRLACRDVMGNDKP